MNTPWRAISAGVCASVLASTLPSPESPSSSRQKVALRLRPGLMTSPASWPLGGLWPAGPRSTPGDVLACRRGPGPTTRGRKPGVVTRLVLDSGGVSRLARRSQDAAALSVFVRRGSWPPVVPTVALVECFSGRPQHDAVTNRFLKTCDIVDEVPEHLARRAGVLRAAAQRGPAVDALAVAIAEPSGSVLTGDIGDLRALAAHAEDVSVIRA